MKIIFAIKAMNNPGGGAERVLAEVASGLAEMGYEIVLISFDAADGQSYYPLHQNIKRIALGIGDTTRPATLLETSRRILELRKIITGLKPDIVVGFMHSMFIPLGIALLGSSIPLVASEHVVPQHYVTRPLERLLLKITPWLSSVITVVSEQARAAYPALLQKHMVVIPNPVSIRADGSADTIGSERKVLLTVGRLSAEKDHITLIRAFAGIADNFPDWDLRIIGEGELRTLLKNEINRLHLQGRVQMPGSKSAIYNEYSQAQLFVVSSRYESFGLAAAEALAHGLPVIGFADCTGINTLIRHDENGILVEGKDRVQALAEGLQSLMSDPARRNRLGSQAKTSINNLDLSVIVGMWQELLKKHSLNSTS
jgi:glycosyltransferase involved in cell wall biosynthesis